MSKCQRWLLAFCVLGLTVPVPAWAVAEVGAAIEGVWRVVDNMGRLIKSLLDWFHGLNLQMPIKVAFITGIFIVLAAFTTGMFHLVSTLIQTVSGEAQPTQIDLSSRESSHRINVALFQQVVTNNPTVNPEVIPQEGPRVPRIEESEWPPQNVISTVDRPLVVIANPSVRITHWRSGDVVYGEKIGPGTVTAGFRFTLLNVGAVAAKDLKTKWLIEDNGRTITNPDEWLRTIGRQPWSPRDIDPGRSVTYQYGPHIGAAGVGTLKLALSISYIDPRTGESIRHEYNGFVDYLVTEEGETKGYLMSPIEGREAVEASG